jgi:hypothetical protein
MKGLLIQNQAETLSLAAFDYYGASFSIGIFNQSNNQYISTDNAMTEGIEPVSAHNTTVNAAATKDEEVISVASTGDLAVGDRISVHNFIYRITNINGTNITLHKGLYEDLSGVENVARVGNMGVYSLELTVTQTGTFLLQAKDSVFGLQHTDHIKVNANSIESLIADVNNNIDSAENIITNSQNYTMII